MKIKKLMPIDAESRRLIDWMEIGVYDALQKKYLKTLLFCISEAIDGPMMEEYAFSFSYSNSDSEEVMMNISHTGNEKQGTTFKSNGNTDITPNQMRSSACKMVRTLVQLMGTLDRMPEEVHNQSIVVKEDMDVQVNQVDEKVQKGTNEDYFYLKARYHVKPRLGNGYK
ncbi:hypothetical protein C5167_042422 [Papaver somniferum]|uniref:HORMA domain-containing protein n=1 Tax=Papaver somniferum TaxID=3469 RepID=A0A4Y7L3U0_PAPSO|nr:hypothetical protein C5167_042422 [Papaver somniferum]